MANPDSGQGQRWKAEMSNPRTTESLITKDGEAKFATATYGSGQAAARILNQLEAEVVKLRAAAKTLAAFIPAWVKDVPEGYGETFYGTLSYLGDRQVKAQVDAALAAIQQAEQEQPDAT